MHKKLKTKYPSSVGLPDKNASYACSSFNSVLFKNTPKQTNVISEKPLNSKTKTAAEIQSKWISQKDKSKEDKVVNHNSFGVTKYTNRLEINFQNINRKSTVEHKLNIYDGKHIEHITKDTSNNRKMIPSGIKKTYKFDDCVFHF
ncbi:hypothetical protein KQX54_001628 [Cotesia glomerata]|uniref:Uncharacterized protein n=1 Tax=Cotesia glomerata TaxID=32391 RepID=A0AAV7HW04_COTGL|nr:hypothetical protein KQX54_001628 [Cotesia glomerata]